MRPLPDTNVIGRAMLPIAALAAIVCAGCSSSSPQASSRGPAPASAAADAIPLRTHADRALLNAAADSAPAGDKVLASVTGEATYYADMFEGRRTASGVVFSNARMYAAHREYPFGTVVRVTDIASGRSVVLRVVDRMPPARTERARRTIVDVSQRAAELLGFIRAGRIRVRLDVLEWGPSR